MSLSHSDSGFSLSIGQDPSDSSSLHISTVGSSSLHISTEDGLSSLHISTEDSSSKFHISTVDSSSSLHISTATNICDGKPSLINKDNLIL